MVDKKIQEKWEKFRKKKDVYINNQVFADELMDMINDWEFGLIEYDKEKIEEFLSRIPNLKKRKMLKDLIKKEVFGKKVKKESKKKEDKIPTTSLHIDEEKSIFAEQIYNGKGVKFCVYNIKSGEIDYKDSIVIDDEETLPIDDEEIEKGAILLPSKAEDYESDERLEKDIREYILKWLDVPEEFLQFAVWNIKRSWVYERFHTLNYLRARGDTGLGKTRFLDTLGYIHYKPIATSGATTSAPVFRIIDKWKGTLIMDEADLKKSDESQDMIKIINQGYERGKFVMRCDQNDASKVSFFDPFCPKIIATRKAFHDKAVESRCITTIMKGTEREDIPFNLNEGFWKETEVLRNKLLMWRFKNYFKIDPKVERDFDWGGVEPRVKQIFSSFVSLFGTDKEQMDRFREFVMKYQEDLVEERRNSFEGQILEAIHSLMVKGVSDFSSKQIIEEGELTTYKGQAMQSRSLNTYLKTLGFEKSVMKRVEGNVKRVIPYTQKMIEKLFKRYGLECNSVTVVTAVTGTCELNNNDNLTKYKKDDPLSNRTVNTVTNVNTVTGDSQEESDRIKQEIRDTIKDLGVLDSSKLLKIFPNNPIELNDVLNEFKKPPKDI